MRKVAELEQKVEQFAVVRADRKQVPKPVVDTADVAVAVRDLPFAEL